MVWSISEAERSALEALRSSTKDRRVIRNASVILLSGPRHTKHWIAEQLACSPATVDIVRRKYRQQGLAGLQGSGRCGRPSRATFTYRVALRDALRCSPQAFGYPFSTWSYQQLGQHLERETGIAFSRDQLRRIVREENLSIDSPSKSAGKKVALPMHGKGRKQNQLLRRSS